MPQVEAIVEDERAPPRATGVLLVNLGTPDEPTTPAVRRYLGEFLSDPRVVEAPRWLWWLVLHGYILRVRPARSAAAYRKVWTDAGSPLLVNSRALADGLRSRLATELPFPVTVELGMSYGSPGIGTALEKLLAQKLERLVVLPLYPQYSASTTGSVFDALARELSRRRYVPALRFINQYFDAPGYIAALAASISGFRERNGRGERLLFSFHGLPRRMVDAGDPYRDQCLATARLVARALQLDDREWQVSFQSRVGREEWLRPYTDETLQQWGEKGMGKIDVICPGFAADCLETLEEIAMQNAEFYAASGGGELRYIPALNAREDHVSFLGALVATDDRGALAGDGARPAHGAGNFC
jgi:protoporphyrin/coproporphyrin ferrochelatase